jgi:hypothetical protein
MSRALAQSIVDDTAAYLRSVDPSRRLDALATASIALRCALDLCPGSVAAAPRAAAPPSPSPGSVPPAAPAAVLRGGCRICTVFLDGIIYYEGRRFCSPFRPCTTVEVFPGPGRCVTARCGNTRHVCEPKRPEPSCTIRPPKRLEA